MGGWFVFMFTIGGGVAEVTVNGPYFAQAQFMHQPGAQAQFMHQPGAQAQFMHQPGAQSQAQL